MEQTAGGKSKLRMKSSCRRQLLRNLTRGLEASRTAPPYAAGCWLLRCCTAWPWRGLARPAAGGRTAVALHASGWHSIATVARVR
jgi:hypothetical protein